MSNVINNSHDKMKFPLLCRQYRIQGGARQREVAQSIGIACSTYGNVESNNHKTMSLDRVHVLAKYHKLTADQTAELVAAWDELPASEYNQAQAKTWDQRKAFRSKAKNYDRLKLSLLEVCTLLVTLVPDPETLCTCPEVDLFADDSDRGEPAAPCELCAALKLLGLTGYTDVDDVIAKLAPVQEAVTAELARR